ncbi:HTH-type transcriptional repressor fabR [Glaciecola punicea ACAM 611]|jgi:AcrR family transcriptional regulator|uniref:HTH-type transcriptional repressor fabR n=1 Tax=Glaciecola punicea ACAM 611 TaxID=1121923 RepID=H5TD84_9ALTE|nr:HTH-type transcriptional repressor FabR [Glaciecola punicea]OFA30166.1 DNA-binding transcriptional regulator FabR [Glaciecola punicea]GAB56261.1 HTH-type transcriptional repressor fabR [Glaciecola punicea ACAM 611]
MNRQQQKQQTRQRIIDGAFTLLDDNKSFTTISLREVAREANIAPTSFYRHFADINELGLTLVDESGLALRQLMRQARKRIASGGSIINISVDTFIEFIMSNPNVFRLLLREHTGTSASFRAAVKREIQHFTEELADYIVDKIGTPMPIAYIQSEAMVKLVFSAGAEAIDADSTETELIAKRVKAQLRFIEKGAMHYANFVNIEKR